MKSDQFDPFRIIESILLVSDDSYEKTNNKKLKLLAAGRHEGSDFKYAKHDLFKQTR